MQNSDPPLTPNWADFIDSLHVFNPPTLGHRRWRDERVPAREALDPPPVPAAAEHRAGGEP